MFVYVYEYVCACVWVCVWETESVCVGANTYSMKEKSLKATIHRTKRMTEKKSKMR